MENNYFERDELPGSYEVEIVDGPLDGLSVDHNLSLHEGVANWSINLPEDRLAVGDTLRIQCTVSDETLPVPFVSSALITLVAKEESGNGQKSGKTKNYSGGAQGDAGSGGQGSGESSRQPGTTISGGIDPPTPVRVKRGDTNWARYNFDDHTACVAVEDEAGFTFYINVDNIYLRTELKDSREDVATQEQKFIWGNVLIGLALIHDAKRSEDRSQENEPPSVTEGIRLTTRAIAPFLLPMIDHLGSLSESDHGTVAARGDDD